MLDSFVSEFFCFHSMHVFFLCILIPLLLRVCPKFMISILDLSYEITCYIYLFMWGFHLDVHRHSTLGLYLLLKFDPLLIFSISLNSSYSHSAQVQNLENYSSVLLILSPVLNLILICLLIITLVQVFLRLLKWPLNRVLVYIIILPLHFLLHLV